MKNKTTKKDPLDKGEWPSYALMHLQVARKYGLPKETMKSELEDILGRISNKDLAKAVYEKGSDLSEFVTEDYFKEFFDESIKAGVDRKLINSAANQVVRGILAAHDRYGGGLLESEGDLELMRSKYGVSRNYIQKAFYESYNRKFK